MTLHPIPSEYMRKFFFSFYLIVTLQRTYLDLQSLFPPIQEPDGEGGSNHKTSRPVQYYSLKYRKDFEVFNTVHTAKNQYRKFETTINRKVVARQRR
jgi:hypothetical protein